MVEYDRIWENMREKNIGDWIKKSNFRAFATRAKKEFQITVIRLTNSLL